MSWKNLLSPFRFDSVETNILFFSFCNLIFFEFQGLNQQKPRKRENQNLSSLFNKNKQPNEDQGEEEDEEEEGEDVSSTGSRLQQTQSQKESANNDLRNRLKNRFQKFKAKVNSEDQARFVFIILHFSKSLKHCTVMSITLMKTLLSNSNLFSN
jgi:hypothetical protein